jgi:hypothetical protein
VGARAGQDGGLRGVTSIPLHIAPDRAGGELRPSRNDVACAPHGTERGHRPLGLNGELGTEGRCRSTRDQGCSHRDSAGGYNPGPLPHQELVGRRRRGAPLRRSGVAHALSQLRAQFQSVGMTNRLGREI